MSVLRGFFFNCLETVFFLPMWHEQWFFYFFTLNSQRTAFWCFYEQKKIVLTLSTNFDRLNGSEYMTTNNNKFRCFKLDIKRFGAVFQPKRFTWDDMKIAMCTRIDFHGAKPTNNNNNNNVIMVLLLLFFFIFCTKTFFWVKSLP